MKSDRFAWYTLICLFVLVVLVYACVHKQEQIYNDSILLTLIVMCVNCTDGRSR